MMLGRRGMAAGVELVKMNDNSARAPGENPNSAVPDSNARRSVRREQLKQGDFIMNLDFGKAGAFKAILFQQQFDSSGRTFRAMKRWIGWLDWWFFPSGLVADNPDGKGAAALAIDSRGLSRIGWRQKW